MAEQENLIKILQTVFATKEDIENFKEEMKESNNKVLNSNDHIAKELHDLRIEVTVFNAEQRQQNDILDNHEIRLKTVEAR